MSGLNFTCALITGGGGGLGKAMAIYLLAHGKKVILVGRTPSTLRETAEEIGATDYLVLDTGIVDQIPIFVETITLKYPELDCLINNAGVQRRLSVLNDQPSDFLQKADQEIDINIRGPLHLTLSLLEHFKKAPQGATIINVSSILGFVPASVINPIYNGTKAWLHFWSMNLRSQLFRGGYDKIRVIEIVPPSVATDLHRDIGRRDAKKGESRHAMSVEEYMWFVSAGLERGATVISPGISDGIVGKWYEQFGDIYEKWAALT